MVNPVSDYLNKDLYQRGLVAVVFVTILSLLLFRSYIPYISIYCIITAFYFVIAFNRLGRVSKAEANLFSYDPLVIRYEDLPVDKFYVGRGFPWSVKHSETIRKIINDPEIVSKAAKKKGLTVFHGVGKHEEKDIYMPLEQLNAPTLVVGITGAGKTRTYELPVAQAIKRGEFLAVFDPKGDRELLDRVYHCCLKSNREDDFMLFALPYPSISCSYNPLQNFVISNELADRIAYLIPAGNNSTFKDFAWQVLLDVTNGLLYLGIRPTLKDIHKYSLSDMEYLGKMCIEKFLMERGYGLEVKELEEREATFTEYYTLYHRYGARKRRKEIDDLITRINHPKEHFQKMIASLSPLLKKLSAGEIGELLSIVPSDLDWERAVEKKKVVYMFFGSQLMRETSEAVMQMALQDLASFSGSRYAYKFRNTPVNLFLDEFNDMVGHNFITLLNKGRGAGFRFYLGTQSLADMPSKLPKAEMAEQIMDNIDNMYWMRTKPNTAEYMTNIAGKVRIFKESLGVNFSPDVSDKEIVYSSSYSHTSTEEEVNLVEPNWISRIPDGHGFVISASKLYKVRFPLMEKTAVDYLKKIGIKQTD